MMVFRLHLSDVAKVDCIMSMFVNNNNSFMVQW